MRTMKEQGDTRRLGQRLELAFDLYEAGEQIKLEEHIRRLFDSSRFFDVRSGVRVARSQIW